MGRIITYASAKPKLAYHHTEIHPAENGGVTIKHIMSDPIDKYNTTDESNAYGPEEHLDALKDIHSKFCDSASCGKPNVRSFSDAKKKVADQLDKFKK
jgi:hypothetical protein